MDFPDITNFIEQKGQLTLEPEVSNLNSGFQMFNSGGVETEIGEFLYALVRVLKPKWILETGTHKGISSSYMGLALQKNERGGKVITLEVLPEVRGEAIFLWEKLGIASYIDSFLQNSYEYTPIQEIDLLILDSEPQYRFDEFERFYPMVRPGGFIIIHDLHPNLGHSEQTINGMFDWPFGDYRPKLGPYIKNLDVQTFHLGSPRGCVVFQKVMSGFAHVNSILAEYMEFKRTQKTIIFVHNFRCGGTFLTHGIRQSYQREEILDPDIEFENLSSEQRAKIRFICGHRRLGIHRLLKRPYLYFTLIRNPLERVLSSYWNILQTENHPLFEIFNRYPLEYFLNLQNYNNLDPVPAAITYHMFNNHQVRCLAEQNPLWETEKPYNLITSSEEMLENIFAKAIENLFGFAFVGITEHINQYWRTFERRFGLQNPFDKLTEISRNHNKNRPQCESLSEIVVQKIKDWNRFDCKLWNWVKENESIWQ
jgi:predicted O-methyltransferase YrrM